MATIGAVKQIAEAGLVLPIGGGSGGGSGKPGKNCTITKTEEIEGGTRVTFGWTSDSGSAQTTSIDVMDGAGIASVDTNDDGYLIVTLSDGTEITSDNPFQMDAVTYSLTYNEETDELTLSDGESAQTISIHPLSSGGGSADLQSELKVSKTVGGVSSGKTYAAGTSVETIIRDVLNPVENPTLTNPSASISATGAKIIEAGGTLNTTITVTLNRGSISPAYGTSGSRAGAATGYALNGGEQQTSNQFSVTVNKDNSSFVGTAYYGEGEQPKNSAGENYSTPLAAGSVNTSTLTYEFVDALWSNAANIATVAKEALISKSTKTKTFNFPSQTVEQPEIFDVPASWNVTAVETLNTLSNQFVNCLNDFVTSTVTHKDAAGNDVTYTRYTDNRGYAAGDRQVRIKWS